jgi:hypothetical protein
MSGGARQDNPSYIELGRFKYEGREVGLNLIRGPQIPKLGFGGPPFNTLSQPF